jgi:hypothetical protein
MAIDYVFYCKEDDYIIVLRIPIAVLDRCIKREDLIKKLLFLGPL